MKHGARVATTIELLQKIWSENVPAANVVDNYFKRARFAGSSDRRTIKELFYTIVRSRERLNWWFLRSGTSKHFSSRAAMIIYLSLAEKKSFDELSKLFSGQLNQPECLNEKEVQLATKIEGGNLNHSEMPRFVLCEYPEWLDGSLETIWGPQLKSEILALNKFAPLDLRVNTLKSHLEESSDFLAQEGIYSKPTPLSPIGLRIEKKQPIQNTKAFRNGLVEIQDEGSQIISLLCEAHPGMKVVDFCAGSGGKTLAIAASMKNKGIITACDISKHRLDSLKPRLKRSGATNIVPQLVASCKDVWVKNNTDLADRVLCDVPCSNTGTWRRHPDAKWHLKKNKLLEICKTQRSILTEASTLVKSGGRLIYITCSVLPEENKEQASWFTENFSNFTLVPINDIWNEIFSVSPPIRSQYLHLTPASTNTDGFFCAVFRKK